MEKSYVGRKPFIDTLTILSCIAVVYLHANGVFWSHPSGRLWLTSNFIESFFYFAVPVFFMISGATLMEYRNRYSTNTFVKKRLKRAFVPFLFWSFIAFIVHFITIGKLPSLYEILKLPISFINCTYFSIYWFFIPLFTCYLSIIYLSKLYSDRFILTFLVIWLFISSGLLPFLDSLFKLNLNSNLLATPIGGGYVIYLLLGYMISKINFSNVQISVIYLLGLVGFLIHFLGTWYLGLDASVPINGLFKGYLNFPTVFYSTSIFLLIKKNPLFFIYNNKYLSPVANRIKEYSLGIYLLHGYFIYFLFPKFNFVNQSSIVYRITAPVVTIFLCIVMCILIRKIPYLKKVI